MHELSIALSVIDGVLEHAKKQGDVHVVAVHLKVGSFSGVDKDALEFSYGIACENTALEGSRLVIEQVPIIIYCSNCGNERIVPSIQQMCCPECQTPAYDVRSGRELEITSLEIS
jgi:hydrogenase nickel incorporation protein HypA/HybF